MDDLHDNLWEIIENKREDSVNERKNIMTSGWTESQINLYIMNMKYLMKIEILRFWSTFEILNDFYSYSIGKQLAEKPELNFEEYDKDLKEFELFEIGEDGTEKLPKIEYLFEQAQVMLSEDAASAEKQEKGKKGKKAKKEDKKKRGRGK